MFLDNKILQLEEAKKKKDEANLIVKHGGDLTEAIRLYTSAIELCPPDEKTDKAIFHNNLGIALNKIDKKL